MQFTPMPCPVCDKEVTGNEMVIAEPEDAMIAPGVWEHPAPYLEAFVTQPCGHRLLTQDWIIFFQTNPPMNAFYPVHHCEQPDDAHQQLPNGFAVCPGSDVPHPLSDAAVSLGWWAVEDAEHERKWCPVPAGADGAVPDANRVARERPKWVKSLPAEYQPML